MRRLLTLLLGGCLLPCQANSGSTLLYVHSPDCGACIQFMAEAGGLYPKTREASLMPMSSVTLAAWQAGDHALAQCSIAPVVVTPTYVQIIDCQEVDRITGYSSDELWWFSLKRMVDRVTVDPGDSQAVSTR